MRYSTVIEVRCTNPSRDLDQDCIGLTAGITEAIDIDRPVITVADLQVTCNFDRGVTVRAALEGTSPATLTSPLEAITRLDNALDRSLLAAGLFEEFDVARKVLGVGPQPDPR